MDLRLRGNWKVLPLIVEVGSDVEQETVSLAGLQLPHQSHCCSLIVSIDKLLFFQEVSPRKPAGAAEDEHPGTPGGPPAGCHSSNICGVQNCQALESLL